MKKFIIECLVFTLWGWQLAAMDGCFSCRFDQRIKALAVADNGRYYVVGLASGKVVLVDIAKEECFAYWGNKAAVSALATGSCIAIGYKTGEVCVLDLNMQKLHDLERHDSAIQKIVMDGATMVTVAANNFKLWDLPTGCCIYDIVSGDSIAAVALSSSLKKLYTSYGKIIVEWGFDKSHSEGLTPNGVFVGHTGTIVSLAIQDKRLWSVADNCSMRQWDLTAGKCLQRVGIYPDVEALSVDSHKQSLVIAFRDQVLAYDINAGFLIDRIKVPYHISGKIAVGGNTIVTGAYGNRVTAQKIEGYTIIIKNELEEPISRVELLDDARRRCNNPFSCAPHEHKKVSVACMDKNCGWAIRFFCNDEVLGGGISKGLNQIREILFSYNLKKIGEKKDEKRAGGILATVNPLGEKEKIFHCFFQQTKFPLPCDENDLDLPILTVGKAISEITLTDSKNNKVHAKKDFYLQSQWNILNAHHYAPYQLHVQTTDNMQYCWEIPFLCHQIEGMLSLPEESQQAAIPMSHHAFSDSYAEVPAGRMRSLSAPSKCFREEKSLNLSKKPIFALYEDVSLQECKISGCTIIPCPSETNTLRTAEEQVH